MTTCTFKKYYLNEETGRKELFECPEQIKYNNVCIFHDTSLIPKLKNIGFDDLKFEINLRLANKIEESIKHNKELLCIGFNLPEISIKQKKFSKSVYFNEVNVYGESIIEENIFQDVFFKNMKVYNVVKIIGNKFKGRVFDFTNFYFNGRNLHFFKNEFHGNQTDFTKAEFKAEEEIDFSNNNFFSSLTQFAHCKFFSSNASIYFSSSQFSGQVYFNNSEFDSKQLVIFGAVKFTGNLVSFGGTKFFNRGVTFTRSEFLNEKASIGFLDMLLSCDDAAFSQMKFYGSVSFFRSEFKIKKRMLFDDTNFLNKSDFTDTIFDCDDISFTLTNFYEVYFKKTRFGIVNFNNTEFNIADFTNSKFHNEAYFKDCKFKKYALFNFVTFELLQKIFLLTNDLSNVSLKNTDITRTIFSEHTKFNTDPKEKYKIYDERIFEENISRSIKDKTNNNLELEPILSIYRNLRENYEFKMKYEEAGKFFIREMEVRRNYEEVD